MSDTQTAENADTNSHEVPDIEARARAQGWRPKEEFKGDVSKWKDAQTYVEVGEQFMPVAIERNRALEDKFGRTEAELRAVRAELSEMKQTFNDYREFASNGEKRAYERAKQELLARRDVAVQHADTETFKQVEGELAELAKTIPTARVETTKPNGAGNGVQAPDPTITRWVEENTWFTSDKELNAFARNHDAYLLEAKPGMSVSERLAAVKAKTKGEFPEKFDNPLRDAPSTVAASNGGTPRKTNKRSYDNLPPEAKKACDKYVKQFAGDKKPFTREEYVATYAWDD